LGRKLVKTFFPVKDTLVTGGKQVLQQRNVSTDKFLNFYLLTHIVVYFKYIIIIINYNTEFTTSQTCHYLKQTLFTRASKSQHFQQFIKNSFSYNTL